MSSDETAIPDEAIEAAAKALGEQFIGWAGRDAATPGFISATNQAAHIALAAALPVLRRHIAAEEIRPHMLPEPVGAYGQGRNDALAQVARVVRGDDND